MYGKREQTGQSWNGVNELVDVTVVIVMKSEVPVSSRSVVTFFGDVEPALTY